MAQDYYQLLGVNRNVNDAELKRAYRDLARRLHPDANGGDVESEAQFKEITVAYETLRDPERRRRYDMFGPEGGRGGQRGPSVDDLFGSGLGDIFESFFAGGSPFGGGGARREQRRRGDDVETVVELSFEESIFGVDFPVSVRTASACESCDGTGAEPGTQPMTCRQCSGAGQVRQVRQSILGQVVSTTPCSVCRGFGTVIESPCADCRGDGYLLGPREVTVAVPPGIDDGTTLRVTGEGGAALRGGVPGDLYVHVRVRSHEHFTRNGMDLEVTLHLAMSQATLGTEVEIETLDGTESIAIPAGTQSGKVQRIKGRGVPALRGHGRGDLKVLLFVDVPENLTKEQETLVRELARLRGEAVAGEESGLFSRIRSSLG